MVLNCKVGSISFVYMGIPIGGNVCRLSFREPILSRIKSRAPWVDWNTVCRSKEVGGLRVWRIKEFNIVLLRKWCWRLLVEKESLWFRVLSASYGEEDGWVKEGGCDASLWLGWRMVKRGVGGVDKDDRWLWTLETSYEFSGRSLYNFLTVQLPITLPTKDSLFRHSVIDANSRECVAACVIAVVSQRSGAPSYKLFGLLAFGKFGKK
ncbi:hypothetical protein MTR_3g451530 [Medicago truncatula]|uniref:Uncharacterized protein n=1 Tax=Medicago truncatula TaxID=3880 RepID=A0A072V6C3_MEDTR|nr:hypothetical protein MTR_3g451530 [Medicago truncatula]